MPQKNENLNRISFSRKVLRKSNQLIYQEDFGSGKSANRLLADLESKVAIREKYGKVLYRMVSYFQPATIIELGTSIGISSAYLSLGGSGKVFSLEGSAELVNQARSYHASLGLQNIEIIQGDIQQTLEATLEKINQLDLIFIDSNHNYASTIKYFELCLDHIHNDTVLIFDDIYWSREMTKAWTEIKQHNKVKLTIDLYQLGICFFRSEKLEKEDFVLRY